MPKVLWADDEADEKLEILARAMRARANADLTVTYTLEGAFEKIDGEGAILWDKVITDVILPHNDYLGAKQDVGVEIARAAAARGVPEVYFLTVHREDSLRSEIDAIRDQFAQVCLFYIDKLTLTGSNLRSFLEKVGAERE